MRSRFPSVIYLCATCLTLGILAYIALLELAPSTVLKHLSILRNARLVDSRKDGRWMYYRLFKEFRAPATGKLVELLLRDLWKTDRITVDGRCLPEICSDSTESL